MKEIANMMKIKISQKWSQLMILTNMEISSVIKERRKILNRKKILMNKVSKINDSLVNLLKSEKLKWCLLFWSLLTTVLSFSPKTFIESVIFILDITTKTVDLALIPLSVVNISILVLDLTSTILFSIDEVTFIVMSFFYYLYSNSILLQSSFLINTQITKIYISSIVIDNCFCDCW